MVDILLMNQNNYKILNTKCHLKCYHISVLLSVTRFSHFEMYIATFRLLTASLHQAVDVIRVKSYVDSFLDPTGVPVRVSINKVSLVSKRIMAGLVGVLRDGGSLGTGESYIPVVLFDSLVHRSPCFPDVDFTAFTGNLVNQAILISRIDGGLRSHQM